MMHGPVDTGDANLSGGREDPLAQPPATPEDHTPPHPAIRDLMRDGVPDGEAVELFLQNNAFPLIDETRATFVFRGDVDSVSLQHWIYGMPSSQAFTRIEGTNLWTHVLELRRSSRVEYKFLVDYGTTRELIHDPFNPQRAHDPFGSNSVCQTDGYEVPEWTFEDSEARVGTIHDHVVQSDALGGPRPLQVYLPARYRETRRYPLLVAHDGTDYLKFSSFKAVLDNLIHRLEIPPMIVALTPPGDRLKEYADDERHARFIATELLPALESRYPLVDKPAARGLMGASFGAVATLSTAWRHPGTFGNLLLQSGSFAFTDIGDHTRGPLFDPVVRFVNAFRKAPGGPASNIFVSCGIYESLIYENRSLLPLLQSTGMSVRYTEARDGHNWEAWRDRLREGLSWLFPGPLWMVYE